MIRTFFRLVRQGVTDLKLNPWAQAFTLAAVTLVAFLSGLFLMALVTLNYQLGTVRGETAFQVYWHNGSDMALVQDQWDSFRHLPGFVYMNSYSPQQALNELGERLGRSGSGKNSLAKQFPFLAEKSPLPPTALISFAPKDDDLDGWLSRTEQHLKRLPGVERVVTTPLRDELGQAWRKVSRYVMWPSITFLTLILGLVVGNTIRLSMLAKANEVEILQLVGAYTWYIRLPLLVTGGLLGLIGGALALLLLVFVHSQIHSVLNFPPLLMEIRFLPLELCLALTLVPALMGMAASWLAVRG